MKTFEEWLEDTNIEKDTNISAHMLIEYMAEPPEKPDGTIINLLHWQLGANQKVAEMNEEELIQHINNLYEGYKKEYNKYLKNVLNS